MLMAGSRRWSRSSRGCWLIRGAAGQLLLYMRMANPSSISSAEHTKTDSVQLLFSVTKAITAIAAAHAHRRDSLTWIVRLESIGPRLGGGDSAITVRSVLSHRSGLASLDADLSFEEALVGQAERAVENQDPYWPPGTAHGYHSFTYGLLVDGVFRRAIGRTVGQYVDEYIAGPLGLDLWIGIPEGLLDRVHRIDYEPHAVTRLRQAAVSPIPPGLSDRLRLRSDFYDDPRLLTASWPSMSGTATARSLARLMAATLGPVDGIRIIDEASRDGMIATQSLVSTLSWASRRTSARACSVHSHNSRCSARRPTGTRGLMAAWSLPTLSAM